MSNGRKPHKHAGIIKAWADGAQIQCLDAGGKWYDCGDRVTWSPETEYRVKPSFRYLNVYVSNNFDTYAAQWRDSLKEARRVGSGSIGYLEDKQDGSVPIFHYWGK